MIENPFCTKAAYSSTYHMTERSSGAWVKLLATLEHRLVTQRHCGRPWWEHGEQASHASRPMTFSISRQVLFISFSSLLILLCFHFSLLSSFTFPSLGQMWPIENKFSKISFLFPWFVFSYSPGSEILSQLFCLFGLLGDLLLFICLVGGGGGDVFLCSAMVLTVVGYVHCLLGSLTHWVKPRPQRFSGCSSQDHPRCMAGYSREILLATTGAFTPTT